MKNLFSSLLFAFTLTTGLLAAAPALAEGDSHSVRDAQRHFLEAATEYRDQASRLWNRSQGYGERAQMFAHQLVDVYDHLAEIKVELADSVGIRDWAWSEELEHHYHRLKENEEFLRHAIKRARH